LLRSHHPIVTNAFVPQGGTESHLTPETPPNRYARQAIGQARANTASAIDTTVPNPSGTTEDAAVLVAVVAAAGEQPAGSTTRAPVDRRGPGACPAWSLEGRRTGAGVRGRPGGGPGGGHRGTPRESPAAESPTARDSEDSLGGRRADLRLAAPVQTPADPLRDTR
jgi:hypothetical protein